MRRDERLARLLAEAWERGEPPAPFDLGAAGPALSDDERAQLALLDVLDRTLGDAAGPARPGTRVGRYEVEREIGRGGMGVVYEARDVESGATVALKILHAELGRTPQALERFLREARIGRGVRHPNVVATIDFGEAAIGGVRTHFLAMEHVEGRTLLELLESLGPVPEPLCRHVGREIARGLAAIHAAGAVHRDVKPENVMIARRGAADRTLAADAAPHDDYVVKLTDLGVALVRSGAGRLSQSGAFVGSLWYGAPEQFGRGAASVDGRADLHGLGVTLYELVTGLSPFRADDAASVIGRVLHEIPRPASQLRPQISPFFEELVAQLLEKDPADRPASAAEVAEILDAGESSAWWIARSAAIEAATHRPLRRLRIPRETSLHGRDAEIARLGALWDLAAAGDGQIVLVEGEAGIGKSRLVDEFVGRLEQGGADVNFLFGSYPPGGAATASGAFSAAFRDQLGTAGSAAYLPESLSLVPAFDALLRGEPAPAGAEPLTKDAIVTCFVRVAQHLAQERPTIVLVEDLHFAPEQGRALFASLALATPGHRLLLVGTARPELDAKWAQSLARTGLARIALARLGAKDLVRLLVDALQSEHLAEELAARIALKSDGNPFFVFEILRALREGLFVTRRDDGTWIRTKEIREIQIPPSITELVQARVTGLGLDERSLLEAASCAGFTFDAELVADVLRLDVVSALQRFGQIENQHRLVRSAGRRLEFDHHQVQEVLYAGIAEPLREAYHARIAESIEARHGAQAKEPGAVGGPVCVQLADHFLSGAQPGRALRYLDPALAYLEARYLNAQQIAIADRALAVPGLLAGARRGGVLVRLCGSKGPFDRLGLRARQEEAAREAARLGEEAGDADLRRKATGALAWCLYRSSRYEESAAIYLRALEIARSRGDHVEEAKAEGALAVVREAQGRLAEAQEHGERALASFRASGDRVGESVATGNLGVTYEVQGLLAKSLEYHERHLELSRELGHRQGEALATGNLGVVFSLQGRLDAAQAQHERHLAMSRESGDRRGEARATGNLGLVFQAQGRLAQAKDCFETHVAMSREVGDRHGEAVGLHNLGNVESELGDDDAASARLLDGLRVCDAIRDPRGASLAHLALGVIAARAGDEPDARAWFEKARDAAAATGGGGTETLARCRLAGLAGGDAADALASFERNAERLDSDELREARWLLWTLTGDRTHLAAARRLVDEAVAGVPDELRETMLRHVRVIREIVAASGG